MKLGADDAVIKWSKGGLLPYSIPCGIYYYVIIVYNVVLHTLCCYRTEWSLVERGLGQKNINCI
jgi:hypothetical protein